MTAQAAYAQMGLGVATGITNYLNAGIATKLANAMQKHRNAMLRLTAAMGRDVIGMNEIATRDAAVRAGWAIEMSSARDRGSAEVSAAAAGVQGHSVDRTMRGLRRSALMAHAARKKKRDSEFRSHAQERRNLNVQTILGRDITVNAKPSMLMAGMGLGASLYSTYNAAQPKGDKIGDQIGRWWDSL